MHFDIKNAIVVMQYVHQLRGLLPPDPYWGFVPGARAPLGTSVPRPSSCVWRVQKSLN